MRKKRSSFISWVFADWAELDNVESSLADAIKTYNNNFNKIKSYEDMVKTDLNLITQNIRKMSANEIMLQDRLIIEKTLASIENERADFLFLQLQHMLALTDILNNAKVEEDLVLIETALLQTRPKCNLEECIINIYLTVSEGEIVLHKTIGFPNQQIYQKITCKPIYLFKALIFFIYI